MRRVAAGESAALALLFERHKGRLFGFLLHMVGDHALAEDLLSETFLRLYRARAGYRPGSGFVPWLLAIARNLARGELRRRALLERIRERLFRHTLPESDPWEPRMDDTQATVRAALRKLPEDQRAALVLREYEGLEYRDVARVLGCTEQAARARTYRARVTLREALRGWWEEQNETECLEHRGGGERVR